MATHSQRPEENEEESTTLTALTVEGDCFLGFRLERDTNDSRCCKTNKFISVLIGGGPVGLVTNKLMQ